MTDGRLLRQAKLQRGALTYGQVVFCDGAVARSVREQTLQEVDKGEADGLFDVSDILDHYPLSRRFGVEQNDKIRCVDSFFLVWNKCRCADARSRTHWMWLQGWCVRWWVRACMFNHGWLGASIWKVYIVNAQSIHGPDSSPTSSSETRTPWHWRRSGWRRYHLVSSSQCTLSIASPTVYGQFLTSLFMGITTNYFDDFVSIAAQQESHSNDYTVKAVFHLLGWRFVGTAPRPLHSLQFWRPLECPWMWAFSTQGRWQLTTLRVADVSWRKLFLMLGPQGRLWRWMHCGCRSECSLRLASCMVELQGELQGGVWP